MVRRLRPLQLTFSVRADQAEHKAVGTQGLPDGRRDLRLATSAIVGAGLALAVGILATVVRLDRDRAFYPTVAIVIASLYSLFAVIGGSTRALVVESMVGV